MHMLRLQQSGHAPAKIGKGEEREEKWCFITGFGLIRHVQLYREWQNQNHSR